MSHGECDKCGKRLHVTKWKALETYRILTVPPCPHKFCETCGSAGCSMCSLRLPAQPLFAASGCQICGEPGEFDYLACDDCLGSLARTVQPDRLLENAVFAAAGSPDWWRLRGNFCCDLIPPVGQYIVAGVLRLLRQRHDIVVDERMTVRRRATAAPTAAKDTNIFARLERLMARGTHTLALDVAAEAFSEKEIELLLSEYPVVFLHSSRPALIILMNELN